MSVMSLYPTTTTKAEDCEQYNLFLREVIRSNRRVDALGNVIEPVILRPVLSTVNGITPSTSTDPVIVFSPTSIFSIGQQGFWYEPYDITTLFQDFVGTTPVTTLGDSTGRMLDASGNNNHAVQTISTKCAIYNVNPSRITLDKVDDEFVAYIPTGGWIGTLVVGTTLGTASYEVSLPAGSFSLLRPLSKFDNDIVAVAFRNGGMTETEKTNTKEYFIGKGAVGSYVATTNFTYFWYGRSEIKDFPLIDTSSGTNFGFAWLNCSNLTTFPLINTSKGMDFIAAWAACYKLTSFPLIDTSLGTNFDSTWKDCSGLISFPLIDTSSATNFKETWQWCTGLTNFPLLNTSKVTSFYATWLGCNLTSFPLLDTSSGISFYQAWYGCSKLTSFPLINTSAGTNFGYAWYGCSGLVNFPFINTSSGDYFIYAWTNCTSLANVPANMFDNIKGGNLYYAFRNTNLTQVSIDNILVSLVNSGIATGTRKFDQSGGSAPSSVGIDAIYTLRTRGWIVSVTGGY